METRSRFDVGDAPGSETADQARQAAQSFGAQLKLQLKELQEYFNHYLSAKADALKLSIRNLVLYAALGIIGLFGAVAFMATSVVLLCIGLAHGLGALFGERYWLGDIVLAVVFLGALALTMKIVLDKVMKTSKSTTVGKYEKREREQRREFGHDVHERAKDDCAPDARAGNTRGPAPGGQR